MYCNVLTKTELQSNEKELRQKNKLLKNRAAYYN